MQTQQKLSDMVEIKFWTSKQTLYFIEEGGKFRQYFVTEQNTSEGKLDF